MTISSTSHRFSLKSLGVFLAATTLLMAVMVSIGGKWDIAFGAVCTNSGTGTGTGAGTVPGTIQGCLFKTSGDNQTGTVGTALTNSLVVTVLNNSSQPAPGVDVVFEITQTPSGAVGQSLASTTTDGVSDKIVFSTDRDGDNEIYMMNSGGTGAVNLTNNSASDTGPALSPSRSRLAFVSTRDGGNFEIFAMDTDGDGIVQLTNTTSGENFKPDWSPDGSKIAFHRFRFAPDFNDEIYMMDAVDANSDSNGDNMTQVTVTPGGMSSHSPAWSPDGTKIAFASSGNLTVAGTNSDGNDEIFVKDLISLAYTQLTVTTAGDNFSPAWSPDGTMIAFTSSRDGDDEIFKMTSSGASQTQLISNTSTDRYPAWSPDGTQITFESYRDGEAEIFKMNSDGTSQTQLTTNADSDTDPYWGTVSGLTVSGTEVTIVTDSNGQAKVNLTLGDKAGQYKVDATSGTGTTPITIDSPFTATAIQTAATIVKVSGDTQTGQVGLPLGSPFVVRVRDTLGNVIQNASVSFAVASAPPGATGSDIDPAVGNQLTFTTTTDVNGLASATLTPRSKPGTYQITATVGSLTPVGFTATGTAGPPRSFSKFTGDTQSGPQNTALPKSLVVVVRDEFSNPAAGATVTFTKASGTGGSVNPTSTTADSVGIASTVLTLGSTGAHTVTAKTDLNSDGDTLDTGETLTFTATAFDVTAATIAKVSGDAQTGLDGATLPLAMVAVVKNAAGDVLSGVTVTFATDKGTLKDADQSGGANTTSTTDSLGRASSTLTLGTAGVHNITATCGACTTTTSVTFTATALSPVPTTITKVSGDTQVGRPGTTLSRRLVVVVEDAQGRPVPGVTVTFTTNKGTLSDDDQAGVASTTSLTDDLGNADTSLTLDATLVAGNVHTVTVTSGSLTPVTFTATTVIEGTLVRVSDDNLFGVVSRDLLRRFRVSAQDLSGNPLPGIDVDFTVTSGGGVLSDIVPADGLTGSDGQVAQRLTLGGVAGANTVDASFDFNGDADTADPGEKVTFTATGLNVFTLSGSVTGVDIFGDPLVPPAVVGAAIKVSQSSFGLSFTATTAADGTFDVDMVAGSGILSVYHGDFSPIADRPISMDSGGVQIPLEADLVVTALGPTVTIEGSVLDKDGVALANAFVTAIEVDPSTVEDPEVVDGARIVDVLAGPIDRNGDGDTADPGEGTGEYILRVPADTFWKVTATALGLGSADVDLDDNDIADIVASDGAGAVGQDITFPENAEVTGNVTVDGDPVGNANISAVPLGTAPAAGNVSTDATCPGATCGDYDGLFLPRPPVGTTFTYILHAVVDGLGELIPRLVSVDSAGNCLNVDEDQIPCVFDFAVQTSIITFNFDTTEGWSQAYISASSSTTLGSETLSAPSNRLLLTEAVDSVGLVVVSGDSAASPRVITESYSIHVNIIGFGNLLNGITPVPPDADFDINVPVPFTISGTVEDQDGDPVEGAIVEAISATFGNSSTSNTTAIDRNGDGDTTDPGEGVGDYIITLPDLRARYQVTARKFGFLPDTFTETITDSVADRDLTLTEIVGQATISGVVGGPPAAGQAPAVPLDVTVTITAVCTNDETSFTTFSTTRGTDTDRGPTGYEMAVGSWAECGVTASADGFVQQNITVPTASQTDDDADKVDTTGGSAENVNIAMTKVQTKPPQSNQCQDDKGCRSEASGSRIILIIPAGAAGTGGDVITIIIRETTDAPSTGSFESILRTEGGFAAALDFIVRNNLGSIITQFSTPVTLRIEDTAIEVLDDVIVGFYDETTGDWRPLGTCTSEDTDGNGLPDAVTCIIDHLTKFSVLSSKLSVASAPSGPTGPTGGGSGGTIPGTGPTVPGAPPSPITPASQNIDSARGGDIAAGNVTVRVPSGVLRAPGLLRFGITPIGLVARGVQVAQATPEKPVPEGHLFGSAAFDLSVSDAVNAAVTQFDQSIEIALKYADSDLALAGGSASRIKIMRYDDATGRWVDLAGAVDAAAKTVTAKSLQPGLFSLIVELPSPVVSGPTGGALSPNLGPLLSWSNPAGTTQYHVQVIPANNDGPGIDLFIGDSSLVQRAGYQIQTPTIGVGNYVMLPGMSYTWRVRTATATRALAIDAPGWSKWLSGSFRTQLPVSWSISPVSPAVGGTVSSLTPNLQWRNDFSWIFYYEVQLSKDSGFNRNPATAIAPVYWELVHGGESQPMNSYNVRPAFPLDAKTTYYWRVRPRVQGDAPSEGVAWSDIWSFRTP